jgi:hypothetical protein
MTTPQKIINTAYGWIGVLAAETPLTPSEAQDGLHQLNNFLAEENAIGVLKGIDPVESLDSDLQEPRYATGFLECNVAVKLAPFYGAQVTQALAAEVVRSRSIVIRATLNLKAKKPETLPIGSGNDDYYSYNNNTFFPEQNEDNF